MNIAHSLATIPIFLYFHLFLLLTHGEPDQQFLDITPPFHDLEVYVVHVQKPMETRFRLFKHRKGWYESFLPNTTLFSGEPRMIYTYREVITGFAAWITQSELKTMKSIDGFLLARKDTMLELRTTYTPRFLGLEFSGGMWFDSFYGHDKIIAVIDTGVKPTHPSFSGQGMSPAPTKWNGTCYWTALPPLCNNKIIGAQAFLGGKNMSPLDKHGHGTHTASIASGNFVFRVAEVLGNARGTASGMAPKAHLAIYKAGSTVGILKSIDDAIHSNVDVISMSLGDRDPNYYFNSIAIGSFAAVTKGIVSCAAAPNRGPFRRTLDNDAPVRPFSQMFNVCRFKKKTGEEQGKKAKKRNLDIDIGNSTNQVLQLHYIVHSIA